MKCANILPLLTILVTYGACGLDKSSSREESSSSEAKLSTLTLPIPHTANPFTKTIKGCHDDPALVIIGDPSGTLEAGTRTAYLPPQASALSTTYVDKALNLTEVIIATPLPGSCASLSIPAAATETVTASPTDTPDPGWGGWNNSSCPDKGCSKGVDKSAQLVIASLNEITYTVQKLQAATLRVVGAGGTGSDEGVHLEKRFSVIHDLIIPLKDIPAAIFYIVPRLELLVAFPRGCDTDTIAVALVDLVDVYTDFLGTLKDSASYFKGGERHLQEVGGDGGATELGDTSDDVESFHFVASLIVAALRSTMIAVELLAYALIALLPTRRRCIEFLVQKLADALADTLSAYE